MLAPSTWARLAPRARVKRLVAIEDPCDVDAKASQCPPSPPGGTFGPRTVPSARQRMDSQPRGHETPPGAEDASRDNIDEPIEGPGVGTS